MFTLLRRWYERHFSQPGTIEFALVLTGSFIIVYYFMWLVGPIVVALCLAFCLDWPVEYMKRRFAISRKIGATIVMFVFSSLLVSATLLLVPNVIKQGAEFYNSVVSFSTDDSSADKLPQSPPESLSGGAQAGQDDAAGGAGAGGAGAHSPQGHSLDGSALKDSSASNEAGISAAAGYRSGSSALGSAAEAFAHVATAGGAGTATGKRAAASGTAGNAAAGGAAGDAAAGGATGAGAGDGTPGSGSVLSDGSDRNLSPEGVQALSEQNGSSAGAGAGAGVGAEAALDGPAMFSARDHGRKNETTIVYITGPGAEGHGADPQSKEKMAQAVASAALAAAEIELARRDGSKGMPGSDHGEVSTVSHNGDNDSYQITLINGSGEQFNFSSNENEFTLSVTDFDARLAKELHDVVLNLPDPLPGMLTQSLIEESVRNARMAATNKMADLMRTQLMPSVVNAFTWLVYAIIVPIFTFLMLYNKEQLQIRAMTFILPNNQVLMRKFWPSIHRQIGGYIRGKLLHIIIIAIANTLAFMLLDVNYALLLGVGVGLSVVIPYVGAVIIAIPVVMVAIFQFGFSTDLISVLVVYTVIQLLDSNVLTPMLFSKAMNLDAFSILAAILIFGNLWGFWGVFFAIPLATFIKTLIVKWPNAEPVNHKGERI